MIAGRKNVHQLAHKKKTKIYLSNVFKTHNSKGPAIVNKDQKIKEYYLYGIKMTKDEWEKKRKYS